MQGRPAVTLHTGIGVGKWQTELACDGRRKTLAGREDGALAERMALRSLVESLRALKQPCGVRALASAPHDYAAADLDLWDALMGLTKVHAVA